MDKKIIVDTQGFVTICPQFVPKLQITVEDCESCEYHKGIIEVWPGKDGEPVDVKAAEMTVETFVNLNNVDTGKNRQYDIICGLPTRSRAIMFAKFADKEE